LTTATLGREPLFADAANVAILIDTLRFVERKGFSHSLAWVVMPDHLHWLMELRGGTLAECMALLKITQQPSVEPAIGATRAAVAARLPRSRRTQR